MEGRGATLARMRWLVVLVLVSCASGRPRFVDQQTPEEIEASRPPPPHPYEQEGSSGVLRLLGAMRGCPGGITTDGDCCRVGRACGRSCISAAYRCRH